MAKHRVQFPPYLPWKERTMLHTVSFGNIPRISTRALYISGGRPSKNLPHPATKRVSPGKVRKRLTTFSDVVKLHVQYLKNIGKGMKVNRRIFIRTVKLWRL